jgi:hypothetical protein
MDSQYDSGKISDMEIPHFKNCIVLNLYNIVRYKGDIIKMVMESSPPNVTRMISVQLTPRTDEFSTWVAALSPDCATITIGDLHYFVTVCFSPFRVVFLVILCGYVCPSYAETGCNA